jgi:hypothetical protein
MELLVAPVDQVFPDGADELSVTDPPSQKLNGPLAEMMGAAGVEVREIVNAPVALLYP